MNISAPDGLLLEKKLKTKLCVLLIAECSLPSFMCCCIFLSGISCAYFFELLSLACFIMFIQLLLVAFVFYIFCKTIFEKSLLQKSEV